MGHRPEGLLEKELTGSVIGAFFDAYNTLGFGFLEHLYALALERELLDRGHRVGREVSVSIHYKGAVLTSQRLDMVVDERLIVETKATQTLPPLAAPQLHNYLRATNLTVGLLLHFGPEPKFYRLVSTRTSLIPAPR
ncbi:MAG: GxxExxY protein [Gemmatimonadaceae bacterium]